MEAGRTPVACPSSQRSQRAPSRSECDPKTASRTSWSVLLDRRDSSFVTRTPGPEGTTDPSKRASAFWTGSVILAPVARRWRQSRTALGDRQTSPSVGAGFIPPAGAGFNPAPTACASAAVSPASRHCHDPDFPHDVVVFIHCGIVSYRDSIMLKSVTCCILAPVLMIDRLAAHFPRFHLWKTRRIHRNVEAVSPLPDARKVTIS